MQKLNQKGVVLILVMMIMSLLLFMLMFFLNSSLAEKKIASSHAAGVKSYYLAEAGVNEMIWLIVNEPLHEAGFTNESNWSTTTLRNNPFGAESGAYTVTASNTSESHCEIVAVGQHDLGNGNFSQRIIKTSIFRAIGTSSVQDSAGFADGNIIITNAYVKFLGGSAHSNNTFIINNNNVRVFIDSDVRATNNYNEHIAASTTIHGWIYANNWASYAQGTGTSAEIDMPAVDFNSADPNSYLNRAQSTGEYWTESDFDDEICNAFLGSNKITLNKEVTYVDGDVELAGPISIEYPPTGGVLIVDGDFEVGKKDYKQCGGTKYYGRPNLDFNQVATKPSGILASKKMLFLEYTGDVNIEGVLYADAQMDIKNLDTILSPFYVRGGAISQQLDIDSCYGWPTIEHDNTILVQTLGSASSSPTIIIEHWEEEY